jgi:hypothetical protein
MPTPRRPAPQPRRCALPDCGQVFTPARRDARYCSDQCRWVANKRDKRGTNAAGTSTAPAVPVTPARPAPLAIPASGPPGASLPQAPRRPAMPPQAGDAPRTAPGGTPAQRTQPMTWTDAIATAGWRLSRTADGCQIVESNQPCAAAKAQHIASVTGAGGWICSRHYTALCELIGDP